MFFLLLFLTVLNTLSGQHTRLSRSEVRQAAIDSVFSAYERQGFNTAKRQKYIYYFTDRHEDPLEAMAVALEKDTIEVISIHPKGKKWELIAFSNEIHSRGSLFQLESKLRRVAFFYKVDTYNRFTIAPPDIDLSPIPDDRFYPFILSLSDEDLFNLAIRLDKIREYNKALLAFQELINRGFKSDSAYFKMGSGLVSTHEYVKGIEHWQKATEINPSYLEAYMNLGIIFYENSHWEQAYESFKAANRIKPDDDVILYNLAKSLIKLERYNEAYNTIRRALKLNPKNRFAKGVLKSLKSPAIRKLRKQHPEL